MKASFFSSSRQPAVLSRYGVAIVAAGLALLLTGLLLPALQEPVFALFFIAVLVSTWYGGLGPGLLTTALSTLLAAYYIFSPIGQFIIDIDSVIWLGVEVVAALIISSLTAARRSQSYPGHVIRLPDDTQQCRTAGGSDSGRLVWGVFA
jgi:K+-sensing histidine kinase KdpD